MNRDRLIHEYNPGWKSDFNNIKATLLSALSGLNVEIEHVGSTSVPGLAAKPIIDIDIVYDAPDDFNAIKDRLAGIGYFYNGDQGIPGREAFKRNNDAKKRPFLDGIRHHLYACQADAAELKRHILFRDFLRENERARKEYRALKLRLAEKTGQDKAAYALLKEERAREFILSIVARAEKKKAAK
ncbi:MAG: GrpB family protein [Spirochaetales bacterium]|nr:GrpB family protein [Spirochaetales bacterium]